jgi:hypothetical protein
MQRKAAEFQAEQEREAQKAAFARQQAGEQAAFDWHLNSNSNSPTSWNRAPQGCEPDGN